MDFERLERKHFDRIGIVKYGSKVVKYLDSV